MSGRSIRSASFTMAVILLAACGGAADTAEQDAALLKASEPAPITQQEAEASIQAFVNELRNGDASKAAEYYAADATFISARGKVDGVAGITAFWTEALKTGAGKDLTLHPLSFGTSGDLAWSLSHYVGGITAPRGHVLGVVQRQADGSLKIVAQVSIPEASR